jgi:hypothetical protein
MCNAPGVEQAVREGASLPEGTPLDTGAGSTARLRQGEAVVEMHPNSQVRQVAGVLELSYGRVWAELPEREGGGEWTLRTHEVTLHSKGARFVWWAFESKAGEVGVPFRPGDGVGVEVVSGELELSIGDETIKARAGQRCWGAVGGQMGRLRCEPVVPE